MLAEAENQSVQGVAEKPQGIMERKPIITPPVTAFDIKAALAQRYGNNQDEYFLTEVKNGATHVGRGRLKIFDALSIRRSYSTPRISGFEIKVSRSDFLGDNKWPDYLPYCHEFSFVCPDGLIKPEELDNAVGLIYYKPETRSLRTIRKAQYRLVEFNPQLLLYIIFSRLDPERIPFGLDKQEFYREQAKAAAENHVIGAHLSKQLAAREKRLRRELDDMKIRRQVAEESEYKEFVDKLVVELRAQGMYCFAGDLVSQPDKYIQRIIKRMENNLDEATISSLQTLRTSIDKVLAKREEVTEKHEESGDK